MSDLKIANLKKDAVSSIYLRFLTYRSYLSDTEKSNTYHVLFPQASVSKQKSVSLNQLKGLQMIPSLTDFMTGRFYIVIFFTKRFHGSADFAFQTRSQSVCREQRG